ncbi:membrane alanyl aminopeptidase [Leptospira broomii serovar Hurstbridge str. 5399]|uniref:Aminopeptidase N n=1 Tax=Leptospira broomii serovar Hurstbridge str. 5399 TaxID=1049789 RepID=T0GJI0_9LEPT|nr:aminopeptidase N [Leptospira broomii]EQA46969.1 membrane alanyl aminopeptidase [Leptospira broomii serovar Hurstbridge str. 5399]
MDNILTQQEALLRSNQISDVSYSLKLELEAGSQEYSGDSTLRFVYSGGKKGQLKVDFVSKKIEILWLNGKEETNYEKKESSLQFPAELLLAGKNELRVKYKNTFDHTGSGFHKFKDPADSAEYMHTDFEPFEAHRLFPSFDQPDLKAVYDLEVTGPIQWTYIHNTLPISEELLPNDRKRIRFNATKKFSTYLFALIVGPYAVWEDKAGNIPLRLFCRKSLAKFMDAPNIFAITKEAFGFLQDYFGIPYPYGKYDQIFVPEFNMGAMENVGAVTFSESYIFRGPRIYSEYLNRANTIYHEMVHMWFGNLVTMRWWNDLWLNESFADYLSYYSMSKGKLFSDALEHFYVREEWAYREDQLSTTHPIAGKAENTLEAISNFDGISYSKGASVLRQLMYYVGEEKFRNAMRLYFKRHAEGNTVLEDFLASMSEISGIDVRGWSREWLETTGVNTLSPARKNEKSFLLQRPSDGNNLYRTHALQATLYRETDGQFVQIERKRVLIKGEETLLEESLQPAATDLLLLNTEDYAYAKTYLPAESISLIKKRLDTLSDRFSRRIVWGSLWQMVRDAELSPRDFLELVFDQGMKEPDLSVRNSHILTKALTTISNYLSQTEREAWSEKLNVIAKMQLAKKTNVEQEQILWFRILESTSRTQNQLAYLKLLLQGKESIFGLPIDQERRWGILARLSAFGDSEALNLLLQEEQKDGSDLGAKKAFLARISFPDPEIKKEAWDRFKTPKEEDSSDFLRFGMRGFQWDHQKEILIPFVNEYFDSVIPIYEKRDPHFSGAFGHMLFPSFEPDRALLQKTQDFLKNHPNLPKLLRKDLQQQRDDLVRTLRILEKYKK